MIQIQPDQVESIGTAIKVAAALVAVVGPVFSAGAAYMAVKSSLNGVRAAVKRTDEGVTEIRGDVKTLVASDATQNAEISGMKATIEAHHGWIGRVERIAERRGESRE